MSLEPVACAGCGRLVAPSRTQVRADKRYCPACRTPEDVAPLKHGPIGVAPDNLAEATRNLAIAHAVVWVCAPIVLLHRLGWAAVPFALPALLSVGLHRGRGWAFDGALACYAATIVGTIVLLLLGVAPWNVLFPIWLLASLFLLLVRLTHRGCSGPR